MTLPTSAYTDLTELMSINRILNGMWQVSGGHGTIDREAALTNMLQYHADGFTTWDLADHYGPAEELIGQFRTKLAEQQGEDALNKVQAFTKWVPRPRKVSKETVTAAIELSKTQMRVDQLDMLQFHWWDYKHTGYLDALKYMADMQANGDICYLSLTNFDTDHTAKIIDSGIQLLTNQVQYSIIDQRPQVKMVGYYQEQNIQLLTYGTLAGGLLTDRYLNQPDPRHDQLTTASLRKYKNMIDVWGGWTLFQELLNTLRQIADKHSASIANVAVRYILQQAQVAGVIAGARLGISDNRSDNKHVFTFALDENDFSMIEAITARSNNLFEIIGDCGDEYRTR